MSALSTEDEYGIDFEAKDNGSLPPSVPGGEVDGLPTRLDCVPAFISI